MSETTKRLFISLEVPQAVKASVGELSRLVPRVVWHPADNFHITIKFIGDTPVEKLAQLESLMEFVGKNFQKFTVDFERLKVAESRLRLLVANPQNLKNLRATFDRNLNKIGLIHNDPMGYEPHVTLGKTDKDYQIPQINFNFSKLAFEAKTLILFETLQGEKAAIFKPVKTVELAG